MDVLIRYGFSIEEIKNMMDTNERIEGYIHICPVCKKEFYARSEWVYKKRIKKTTDKSYICSWGCLRKIEKGEWDGRSA